MKRSTMYMATAAAVLMVTAGVASAQNVMKVEVPFAFQVNGRVMEPGTIGVRLMDSASGSPKLLVYNQEARRSYIVMPAVTGEAPQKWVRSGDAKLAFDCSTGACFLAKAWYGHGLTYAFPGPKKHSGETILTEIVMKPDKAD